MKLSHAISSQTQPIDFPHIETEDRGLVVSSSVSESKAILDDPLFPTEFAMELYVQGVPEPLRAHKRHYGG